MRLHIEHDTRYHYVDAPKHLIQLLRLTPRTDSHQRVIEWRITSPGQQSAFLDAFGNASHTHALNNPQTDMHIQVTGVVDVSPLVQGALEDTDNASPIPVIAYLVPTELTQGFPALDAFAKATLPKGLHSAQDALSLAGSVCQAIEYTAGKTDVTSTAKEAFELGKGVCQDHAHVMIAACRSLGVSARYVSGYVDSGHDVGASMNAAASHAWVDVYLSALGQWISVDVTNNLFASDSHCRLAVGRDYLDACPIRGMRAGGMKEQLDVSVSVTIMQNAQQ
jgi:transglutaminase-like putative cysteine protease